MPKVPCKPCLATDWFTLTWFTLVTLFLLTTLSLATAAQNPPAPAPTSPAVPSPNSKDQSQDQSLETLKINVEVVQLFFNVKDKHGALIPNLTKDNFDLFEDGKPQTIKYFKAESDLPLTIGMLIDSSGSQQRVLEMEKKSAVPSSKARCVPKTRPSSSASTSTLLSCRISPT